MENKLNKIYYFKSSKTIFLYYKHRILHISGFSSLFSAYAPSHILLITLHIDFPRMKKSRYFDTPAFFSKHK